MHVGRALAMSGDPADCYLARSLATFIKEIPATRALAAPERAAEVDRTQKLPDVDVRR